VTAACKYGTPIRESLLAQKPLMYDPDLLIRKPDLVTRSHFNGDITFRRFAGDRSFSCLTLHCFPTRELCLFLEQDRLSLSCAYSDGSNTRQSDMPRIPRPWGIGIEKIAKTSTCRQ
jgi:hypothetical protein